MEDKIYLEILKHGVRVWNKWREDYPKAWIRLDGADLSNMNLDRVNFNAYIGRDLSEKGYPIIVMQVMLNNANLAGSSIKDAGLRNANL
jgi:uncharacterized protein YjbI with pentapeptide repeats